MTRRTVALFLVLSLLSLGHDLYGQNTLKRGRNESTMNIPASNAIGNGNITVSTGMAGGFGTLGTLIDPMGSICVGLADIMQVSGRMTFTNFQGLGTSEAHLLITSPGNDRLRFFGYALSGDLYLTTSMDTISGSSTTDKPDYGSFMLPSGIVDLDWVALNKSFPLKTYLSISLADEPGLLFRYNQIALKAGFEWKMYRHSAFVDIGAGLYKEKISGAFAGDKSYAQRIGWFEPGMRYRFFDAYSLLGSIRITAYQSLKAGSDHPLPVSLIRASASVEIPLLYRETNTEAIRTLVFMERTKDQKKDRIAENIEQGKKIDGNFYNELKLLDLKTETPAADPEQESLKKREAIQQKLDELEKLLDETQ